MLFEPVFDNAQLLLLFHIFFEVKYFEKSKK